MKSRISLAVLGLAVAVNAAALAALHVAMVDGVERMQLSLGEPQRVFVSAKRVAGEVAASHCPGTRSL